MGEGRREWKIAKRRSRGKGWGPRRCREGFRDFDLGVRVWDWAPLFLRRRRVVWDDLLKRDMSLRGGVWEAR